MGTLDIMKNRNKKISLQKQKNVSGAKSHPAALDCAHWTWPVDWEKLHSDRILIIILVIWSDTLCNGKQNADLLIPLSAN